MRLASLVVLFGLSLAAHAQGDELGVRYWYSEGKTTRSHSAQDVFPSLGNPTSTLTYEDVTAHSLELHGRKNFGQGAFVKGNLGFGAVKSGSLRDEDFNRGQVTASDTTSTIKGQSLSYLTLDVGGDLWRFGNGAGGLFLGYSYWYERLDAYGIVFNVPPVGRTDPDSLLVVTNEARWEALRVGFAGNWNLSAPTRLTLDAALLPYAHVRNEDSHWLRQSANDLGPAPNIHSNGTGYGFQLDAELRHAVERDWEIGAGLRYWWLRARDGQHTQAGFNLKLAELESQRFGLLLSLTHKW
ncbi:MAG TPA: hypothetical protein VH600_21255 [Burkholderiales bacterium]